MWLYIIPMTEIWLQSWIIHIKCRKEIIKLEDSQLTWMTLKSISRFTSIQIVPVFLLLWIYVKIDWVIKCYFQAEYNMRLKFPLKFLGTFWPWLAPCHHLLLALLISLTPSLLPLQPLSANPSLISLSFPLPAALKRGLLCSPLSARISLFNDFDLFPHEFLPLHLMFQPSADRVLAEVKSNQRAK